jgi:hypothetical protein
MKELLDEVDRFGGKVTWIAMASGWKCVLLGVELPPHAALAMIDWQHSKSQIQESNMMNRKGLCTLAVFLGCGGQRDGADTGRADAGGADAGAQVHCPSSSPTVVCDPGFVCTTILRLAGTTLGGSETCLRLVEKGGDCSPSDSTCDDSANLRCVKQTCVENPKPATVEAGGGCLYNDDCAGTTQCVDPSGERQGSGTCVAGTKGDPCGVGLVTGVHAFRDCDGAHELASPACPSAGCVAPLACVSGVCATR